MEKFALDQMMEFGEQFILKKLADVPEAQINLVCLGAHQALPAHNTNSNVRLLVLQGKLSLTVSEETESLVLHEMVAIPFDTPMQIRNDSDSNAAFLVIKTPNPSQFE